jgi:hypothetical protein
MTSPEKRLARWLAVSGAAYALGAADFLVRPSAATRALGQATGERLEDEEPGLYHALATAYMATIAALALTAARDPESEKALVPPLLVAKAVSSGAMLYRFLKTRRRGFAAGAALDAALLGVTAGLYNSLDDR